MELAAVVLAAGKGTRMKSKTTKVLHQVCGLPMISHVLQTIKEVGVQKTIVVTGYQSEKVAQALSTDIEVAVQKEQLGTAHALLQTEQNLKDFSGNILVVCGDTPLITAKTLAELVNLHVSKGALATVLTAQLEDPTGYGRVIRNEYGGVARIVEQKDAAADELAVKEINTGMYCFKSDFLFDSLKNISSENAQGEYYLTDIIQNYVLDGRTVCAQVVGNAEEIQGINDRRQLADAEAILRRRVLEKHMAAGVTIIDPATTFIDQAVEIGPDTIIYPFSILEGKTIIGTDCVVGPQTRLTDVQIGNDVKILNSVVLNSKVGDRVNIGPFAYIRPETVIGDGVKVGDFVEIKKSNIGNSSKVPHLSYIGDSIIGEKVNIGAGTITCNYDGAAKHLSVIEDGAFIGSNTNLVAPVKVGAGAVIGAGSTITKDVQNGALGVARIKQKNIENWTSFKKQSNKD